MVAAVNERRKDMKQTSGFISTYSADTFGVCSALFELGGMVVMHDASGCNSTYTTHDEPRWYDMDSMVYISGLTEIEAIMGDDAKLIADITEAAKELSPKFIAIAGTPIPAMTGFDFDAASAVITAETGIPAYGFKTTGMRSYIYGAGEAFLRIADFMVNRDITRSENPSVNILGLTPLDFSVNKSAESVIGHYEKKGYDIISTWVYVGGYEKSRNRTYESGCFRDGTPGGSKIKGTVWYALFGRSTCWRRGYRYNRHVSGR